MIEKVYKRYACLRLELYRIQAELAQLPIDDVALMEQQFWEDHHPEVTALLDIMRGSN